MIQDIGSHIYDRAYSLRPARMEDYALCYRQGKVLLRDLGEEGWALPRFCDFPEELRPDLTTARHFFELDGVGCYLCDPDPAEDALAEGWTYCTYQTLRTVRPMEVAFAAITGAQLDRWYKSRAYCGRCGTKMKPSDIERAMVCPDCGMIEYPKICPAVIVAVRNGEKLLLTRYADRPYRGPALIAGFVEVGETLEDTVRREVLEEVGLHVKNIRYYKNQPWSFTDTLLVGFYCDLDGETEIHLDRNELCEGVWMERSELPVRENDVSLTAEMIEMFRLGHDKGETR